ncbi:unnamed protein product [Dovyalis caffra]|uniref:Uncharacterized protein n=1 Tax=Dovyalis caffra TaxID=77055 RepID=A0AAV1RE01_9ROSI|nr:unnamed protein product [Dovyalis caffra]
MNASKALKSIRHQDFKKGRFCTVRTKEKQTEMMKMHKKQIQWNLQKLIQREEEKNSSKYIKEVIITHNTQQKIRCAVVSRIQ